MPKLAVDGLIKKERRKIFSRVGQFGHEGDQTYGEMCMTEEAIKRRAATASYVEDMLGELTQLARHMKCDFLQFLLEMAQQEAANIRPIVQK